MLEKGARGSARTSARTLLSQAGAELAGAFRVSAIVCDPDEMKANLRKKVSPGELCAILLSLFTIGITLWIYRLGAFTPFDYSNYTRSTLTELHNFYYGFWLMPFFALLRLLPFEVGYVLWGLINVAGVWFAARVFNGKAAWAMLVYQLLYMLFYGQISGVIAGALGLAWYGAVQRKWDLAGLGFLIAGAKPQSGLLFGGLLWLLAPFQWRERLRMLIVPVAGVALSFVLYPGWLGNILAQMRAEMPNDFGSIALWRWIGPFGLLLLLPPLLAKIAWQKRFLALICALTLALPYYQQADLLILFAFPVGGFATLGNLGFFYPLLQWDALKLLAIAPLAIYLAILLPEVWAWWKGRKITLF
jgi:hypothetical protein